MTSMSTDVREEVRKLAEKLPPDATWDQVMYEIYVRQKIAEGESAIAEGRTVDHEEVRKQFGLDSSTASTASASSSSR
jgi:predicted transcriptional regulator